MLPKGKEQFEIGLLREQEYKTKYNLEVKNAFEKLSIEGMVQHDDHNINIVEAKWDRLMKCIHTALETVLPPKGRTKRKPWMINEILNMMEDRKEIKHRALFNTKH